MRVAHLCRVAPPAIGGMEATIAGLANAQARAGWQVRLVTLDQTAGGAAGTVLHPSIGRTVLRQVGPDRYPFARGLGRALAGADVVHVHGVDGLADQVLGLRGRPPVGISTHGGFLHTRRQWWLKQAWLRSITRVSLARADAIWFTSDADRFRLAAGLPRGAVVPNGVDLSDLTAPRTPEPGRYLVFGRVDAHKGLPRLLDALAELQALGREFHLHVVGEEAREGLQELVEAHATRLRLDVRFHGGVHRHELVEHLQRAELTWFPSHAEGFGLTLVEALAAGAPVIAEPLMPYVEKVEDGVSGLLVPFSSPRRVAERVHGFLDHPGGWSESNARDAGRRWEWSSVLSRWATAYQRLRGSS